MRTCPDQPRWARWLAPLCFAFAFPANAQLAPARVPTDPLEVLEELPPGFSRANARRPGRRAPTAQIADLLALAASTGDMRLAARAERLLQDYPGNSSDPDVLRARAFVAQHDHRFDEAISLLDRLVAADPRDGDALLARAQIHLVQGALQHAGRDCAALSLGVDATLGTLCTASLSLRRGRYASAARLAERARAGAGANSAELRRYILVLRGEIASRAGEPAADRWFQQALQLAPRDVRTLAAFARHLRRSNRPADVETMLRGAPVTDGLLLERALAAKALRRSNATALAAAVDRRFARSRAVGETPELRDEAEYMLTLRADPDRALALALKNFRTQRDAEDVDLLVRSATAARRPAATRELEQWARASGLALHGGSR